MTDTRLSEEEITSRLSGSQWRRDGEAIRAEYECEDFAAVIAAGTPAFLDFLIGESPAERKKLYTAGLDWLDAESRRKYGKRFVETSGAQADAMVKPWMRTWMTDHPPTELHADFLNIAHADIRVATMNSKAWSQASTNAEQDPSGLGLYWSPIDPDIYAVGFDRVHVRPSPPVGAPKASHMAPSYPR